MEGSNRIEIRGRQVGRTKQLAESLVEAVQESKEKEIKVVLMGQPTVGMASSIKHMLGEKGMDVVVIDAEDMKGRSAVLVQRHGTIEELAKQELMYTYNKLEEMQKMIIDDPYAPKPIKCTKKRHAYREVRKQEQEGLIMSSWVCECGKILK